MPHIILEHSPNLPKPFETQELVDALRAEAELIEQLPIGGLRVRAYTPAHFAVADGERDNSFVYMYVRIGEGRSEETKREIGDRLFAVLTDYASRIGENLPLSLGLELQEIPSSWTWKKNNIHRLVKERGPSGD